MTDLAIYKEYFEDFKNVSWQIEQDLRFWKHFLDYSINKFKEENPENRKITESGFSIYNWNHEEDSAWLSSSNETSHKEINDLDVHSKNFFLWIMNLSIVRIYNSTELVLLRSIKKYFPNLADPLKGKKETNALIAAIKGTFTTQNVKLDTKNNRYIIHFLQNNLPDIKKFHQNSTN